MKRDLPTEDVAQGLWDSEREMEAFNERMGDLRADLVKRCTHKNKAGLSRLRYRSAGELYDHEYWSCDACGRGQSYAPVEPKVKAILSEELSFYQYVDAITRLMTMKNVNDVIDALPATTKIAYLDHARTHYLSKGQRIVFGQPLPDEALAAIRDWFETRKENPMPNDTYQAHVSTPEEDKIMNELGESLRAWMDGRITKNTDCSLVLTTLMLFTASGVVAANISKEAFIDLMGRYYDMHLAALKKQS